MSAETDVKRHRTAIQDLQKKISQESSRVAAARKKAAQAVQSGQRSSSPSTQASKQREADRENDRATKAEGERAKLEGQLAARTRQLYDAEAKRDKDRATAQERSLRQLEATARRSESQFRPDLSRQPSSTRGAPSAPTLSLPPTRYDLFICHASEDKAEVARPLYEGLNASGVEVWFDESTLKVGDSLRRKIDEGLAHSTFGVVILSPDFFRKDWPQVELDALVAKATTTGQTVVLPIWHHLSKEDVLRHAPTLSGVLALNTAVMSIDEIVVALVERVRS